MKKKKVFLDKLSFCVDYLFVENEFIEQPIEQKVIPVIPKPEPLKINLVKPETNHKITLQKEIISDEEFNYLKSLSKLSYKQFLQICDYNDSKNPY